MSSDEAKPGRCLLLTGMMGVGKSSVGRQLASRLGWRFIDSDSEIEAHAGSTIATLFAAYGEARFRDLETEILRGLPDQGAVIALGGGAVVSTENQRLLEQKGVLIWLDASIDSLLERTARTHERPLLTGLDRSARATRLSTLQEQRRDAYARARWRIATDGLTPEQVAERILERLAEDPV